MSRNKKNTEGGIQRKKGVGYPLSILRKKPHYFAKIRLSHIKVLNLKEKRR